MTDTIRTEIIQLQQQLAAQHAQLVAANQATATWQASVNTLLTDRFAAVLQSQATAAGLLAEILLALTAVRPEIALLQDIKALLQNANGQIESAPIVAAIEALRGGGPDNTLQRVTSAIFGLAGPAPGVTLANLLSKLDGMHGDLGGALNSVTLMDLLRQQVAALGGGSSSSLELGTVRGFLNQLVQETEDIANAIGAGNNSDLELGTVRGFLNQLVQVGQNIQECACDDDEAASGSCKQPYTSITTNLDPVMKVVFAQFPTPPPSWVISLQGFNNLVEVPPGTRFIMRSQAGQGSIQPLGSSTQRYATNRWQQVPADISILTFGVDDSYGLEVSLCPPGQFVEPEPEEPGDGGPTPSDCVANNDANYIATFVRKQLIGFPAISGGNQPQTPGEGDRVVIGNITGNIVGYLITYDNPSTAGRFRHYVTMVAPGSIEGPEYGRGQTLDLGSSSGPLRAIRTVWPQAGPVELVGFRGVDSSPGNAIEVCVFALRGA